MIYRKLSAQSFSTPAREAKFLLKFAYLVGFYKAGWKPQVMVCF
jgi:hypothetical protein